jgi:WD40 repeat protein
MTKRTTVATILFVSVCANVSVAAFARASSQAAITGRQGHIAFTRAGGIYGDETLFVARADGTNERRLSKLGEMENLLGGGDGSRVVFGVRTPDGRRSAAVVNVDGTHLLVYPLPKGTLNLSAGPISPDGKLIAREGGDESNHSRDGIYLTRTSDGRIVKRITWSQPGFSPGDNFSPDGKRLVLWRYPKDGSPRGSLWLVNTDGTGLRRLTPPEVKVEGYWGFQWSPDGTRILFADTGGVIWTIAPDGSRLTRVFKDGKGRYAITPTWSPDGSLIVFALDPTPDPFQHPANGLYVIRSDGSGLTEVLGGNDFKREPVWVRG